VLDPIFALHIVEVHSSMLQVEQEEEFLTNTLQLKLARVEQERVAMEVRLEQEQEYITNKLQKQIAESVKEKSVLEARIKEEREKVVSMEEEKKKLQIQLRQLRMSVEVEEENISNKVLFCVHNCFGKPFIHGLTVVW
jgi:chromosome segregation ATPase